MQGQNKFFIPGGITWKTFPDRTPDIKIDPLTVKKLNGGKVVFFANFSFQGDTQDYSRKSTAELFKEASQKGDEKLFEQAKKSESANESQGWEGKRPYRVGDQPTPIMDQFALLNSLSHYGVNDLSIVLPYFPVGTMERITQEGEIPTAFALAHSINTIPNGGTKNKLYLFDIHALCSRFFFHTNTNPSMISMMGRYINHIETNYNGKNNFIVFPDDGAKKRFDTLIPKNMKKIVCSKVRKGDERIIVIEQDYNYGDFMQSSEANLFLIDDLVQSGGTILETFKGIEAAVTSAGKSIATNNIPMITHSIFPNESHTRFFDLKKGDGTPMISNLITTNSCPIMARTLEGLYKQKVTVLDISPVVYDFLTNPEHEHGSKFGV